MTDSKPEIKRQVQVQQTYRLLWQALDQLMSEKEFDKISISSVCLEAGIARRTFYRHFSTIDELLKERIEQLIQDFYQLPKQTIVHFDDLIVAIYSYFKPHKAFLSRLNQRGKSHLLQQVILENRNLSIFGNGQEQRSKLIYYFGSGGISNLLQYFIVTDFQDEIAEVREMANELLVHFGMLAQYEKKHH
ncbi:TetR/AcrR family transcriptional regulator [Fructobacillus evanidus]|uniref:AcrR family n=1 Tax=Fructobacillus evanidus TaxID=3064281 RepID=A0ABN9YM19_9LACO|nr:AcrR family [Fructobacillus sp. LMG 32999]CAK1232049.1 AcrR family [Fructobacillus sp. LMG 32999]CAK1232536.1 AcrR family [Fructobacillus sp. LMG 32999]CAK1236067.1 AcrR family [Fructobacillus sp. LMG 32999]CAK1238435.1 AcrR family [Fructobacillus sp. LMG 32999]